MVSLILRILQSCVSHDVSICLYHSYLCVSFIVRADCGRSVLFFVFITLHMRLHATHMQVLGKYMLMTKVRYHMVSGCIITSVHFTKCYASALWNDVPELEHLPYVFNAGDQSSTAWQDSAFCNKTPFPLFLDRRIRWEGTVKIGS